MMRKPGELETIIGQTLSSSGRDPVKLFEYITCNFKEFDDKAISSSG